MDKYFDENINKKTNNYYFTQQLLYNQFGGKYKWKSFCHNGVMFPSSYKKHNIPVIYKGKKIVLKQDAEELATLYARYKDTEYIKNSTFRKNFWSDWKLTLDGSNIRDLESCDFSLIHKYIIDQREKQKEMTKEEKERRKKEREIKEEKYKFAIVDGIKQPVGNFRVEPPGIFIGRGCHPKLGKVKPRIYPEDIILNIGKECPIPGTLKGHHWGKIINDRKVEWLASWKDNITGKVKYVWLGNQSKFKAESDIKKFELSRKLKRKIKKIRDINNQNLSSSDINTRQVATALYFIDVLALRVGNEKSSDEADTVGVTSLRVEHIKLGDKNKVTLDFLGKDSIRYKKEFVVDNKVYKNLKEFISDKNKNRDLFDKVTSNDINRYLQGFMNNLTAKVFRTFNASYLFQKELNKVSKKISPDMDKNSQINMILDGFNKANIKVAILCNHQKKVSKNFNSQIEKFNERIKNEQKRLRKIKNIAKNEERRAKIKSKINELKAKRDMKIELKDVSLETSKVNYIDPRITVSFMKKHDLPIDKIFSKQLQTKFKWAFFVDSNWKY